MKPIRNPLHDFNDITEILFNLSFWTNNFDNFLNSNINVNENHKLWLIRKMWQYMNGLNDSLKSLAAYAADNADVVKQLLKKPPNRR